MWKIVAMLIGTLLWCTLVGASVLNQRHPTLFNTLCVAPSCGSQEERNLLHPTEDPNFFYQCAPAAGGGYRAMRMPCAPGTWFGFRQQVCVWPRDWQNPCINTITPEPTTTTTAWPTTAWPTTTVWPTTALPTTTWPTTTWSPINPGICAAPFCVGDEINRLHPHTDRRFFYQCAPAPGGGFWAVQMPCAPGTWFGYRQQVCVWPQDWMDPCINSITPEPTTTTTAWPTTTTVWPTTTWPTTTTALPTTTWPTTAWPSTTWSPINPGNCATPQCVGDQINRLHPHSDRRFFYQCAPAPGGGYRAVQMPCASGTWFGYRQQVCVWPGDWVDPCTATVMSAPARKTARSNMSSFFIGRVTCATPLCVGDEINRLHPHIDRNFFYQCAPAQGGGYRAVQMPCAAGTWFGYRQQVCVWPRDWVDPCINTITPAPTTAWPTTAWPTTAWPTTTWPSTTWSPITPPPGTGICDAPLCVGDQINRLHPHINRNFFYQCAPAQGGGYRAVQMPCAAGTWFGYRQQVCVWPRDWVDPCINTITPAPTTAWPTTAWPTTAWPTTTWPSTTWSPITPPPGTGICDAPLCVGDQINRLHPHINRNFFYQCAPAQGGGYRAVQMPCAAGTWFGYRQQVCVWPGEWEDSCSGRSRRSNKALTLKNKD